jgi:glycosyltransferase involved in cell wall biosynthesis
MKLSIIIPVFNEKNTIEKIINKINNLKNLDKEIIVVDDFSNDRTTFILKKSIYKKVNKIIYHKKNLGKGAAIKSAKKFIYGDIIIIQDADLEYDPKDYYKLIMKTQNVNLKINYVKKNLNGTQRKILDC